MKFTVQSAAISVYEIILARDYKTLFLWPTKQHYDRSLSAHILHKLVTQNFKGQFSAVLTPSMFNTWTGDIRSFGNLLE